MSNLIRKTLFYSSILLFFYACSSTKDIKYRSLNSDTNNNTWIVAHRALTGEDIFPENSIATIESCIAHGLDIIEIDVRETKDGELIVMHDKTVDRTTNAQGKVVDYTLDEIQKLKLVHNGVVTPYTVPTLEEVFKVVKSRIIVDLDIKLDGIQSYQKIADLINKYKLADQMIVFLYDKDDIEPAHSMFPKAHIMPRARSLTDIDSLKIIEYINIIHIDENSYNDIIMKDLIVKKKKIWMNTLGHYDKLEKENKEGFKQFFLKYPNVNVVQTDLGVQLKALLKYKNL